MIICDETVWFGGTNHCTSNCPGLSPTQAVIAQLDAAIAQDDPVAVAGLVRAHAKTMSFNEARGTIQVRGCNRSIIANLPVGDQVSRALQD